MSSTKVINHFPLRPTLNFGLYERDDFILDKCATERSENHDEEKRRSRVAVVAIAHAACALFVERARARMRGKVRLAASAVYLSAGRPCVQLLNGSCRLYPLF